MACTAGPHILLPSGSVFRFTVMFVGAAVLVAFKTGSHCAALAGLKLVVSTRLAS